MIAGTPQLGVLIMDDGREFGDDACTRIPRVRPTSVRLAIEGAPDRPGLRTVATVPPEKFNVRTAITSAAAEGLFWVAAPRNAQDPLTAFVDAARGAGGVLDEDHPGFAVAFAAPEWHFSKVALVADLRDPVTTGVAAWAAVGIATQFGTQLDVLVLGADSTAAPSHWREAIKRFTIRGDGEQMVVDALERAEAHGLQLHWRPLGSPVNKPNAVLRAVVEGGYDVVVDDLPPITVGPKVGRRRRVQAALSQAGSNATAYRLVRDAPCSVVVVLDAVRMGLLPRDFVQAGAATLALGVVGVGTMAAAAGPAAAETSVEASAAMPATEGSSTEEAVAQAQTEAAAPAPDMSMMTEADLAVMQEELAAANATRDQTAAELNAQKAAQAEKSKQLEQNAAERAELQPQLDQATLAAEEAGKQSTLMQIMTTGPLEKLPGGPTQEEADAAQAEAEAAEAKAAALEGTYQTLIDEEAALTAELATLEGQIAQSEQDLAAAEATAATLGAQTAELKYQLNPIVIPTEPGYSISTTFGVSGGYWSSGYHTGLDFAQPTGADVYAAKDGQVIEAGWGGAYGNTVVIQHADGTQTRYAHLSAVHVSVGETVTAGQHIGDVGSTGNTTGPHLHFEVMDANGNFIDPAAWLGM